MSADLFDEPLEQPHNHCARCGVAVPVADMPLRVLLRSDVERPTCAACMARDAEARR